MKATLRGKRTAMLRYRLDNRHAAQTLFLKFDTLAGIGAVVVKVGGYEALDELLALLPLIPPADLKTVVPARVLNDHDAMTQIISWNEGRAYLLRRNGRRASKAYFKSTAYQMRAAIQELADAYGIETLESFGRAFS